MSAQREGLQSASAQNSMAGRLTRWIIVGGCLMPLALFLISLIGDRTVVSELLVSFRLQLVCLMFVGNAFMLSLRLRRKFELGVLYLGATLWGAVSLFSVYLPAAQPPAGNTTIRVMIFNLYNLNSNPQADYEMMLAHDPDLLLLTEFTDKWSEFLQPLKSKYRYTYAHPRWHGYGIALLSKYPLTDKSIVSLSESTDVPMIVATVTVGEQKLRVLAVHTVSPVIAARLRIRNQQLEKIAQQIPPEPRSTILIGDFNIVPWSGSLKPILKTGLRDSRQGFGFQPTWHRQFGPLKIPIDHAFVSADIHVHSRDVGQSFGSDHFPVIMEISIGSSDSQ